MPYRPWCPKCGGPLVVQETLWSPVVGCRCGFQIVDNNQIRGFVKSQQREYEAQETKRRAQALLREKTAHKRLEEAQAAEREQTHLEAERQEALAEENRRKKVAELPQPTAAQRKQGYTHPVHCEVCGVLVWRRRGAVKKGGPFFCKTKHQAEWRKANPVGRNRKQARNTG